MVVASILLAFSIDAWWDDRGERAAERMLLQRLQADFTEIQSAITLVEDDHRESAAACIALLDFATGEPLPATADVDKMVAMVFLVSRTFNPGSGAVASFLASDGSHLVRNQPLADLLLAWSGLLEELQEEEANLQKGVSERWTPFLSTRVNVGPYLATFGVLMSGLPQQLADPAQRRPLTVDEDFVNQVLDRFKWQQLALRDIAPLHAALEEILQLLDGELGNET